MRRRVWVTERADRRNLAIEWIDEKGRRRCKSARTNDRAQAERVAADWEYRLNHGLIDVEAEALTWSAFRERFSNQYACHKRPRTREKFDTVFDLFESVTAPSFLSDVTTELVSRFAASMRAHEYEAVTIRNYLTAIQTAMRWAAEQRLIPSVPKFPHIKVSITKPPIVPAESVERLFARAKTPSMRALFGLAWFAGLRISEAMELRWERSDLHPYLDLDANRIIFPPASQKNGQDQWVPLHRELRVMLANLDRVGDKVLDLPGRDGDRSRGALSSVVCRMARQAGVKLSMHRLRKGFGSRLAKARGKAGAAILHRMMRHSSMQVTMDYYAHVDDALEDAIDEI